MLSGVRLLSLAHNLPARWPSPTAPAHRRSSRPPAIRSRPTAARGATPRRGRQGRAARHGDPRRARATQASAQGGGRAPLEPGAIVQEAPRPQSGRGGFRVPVASPGRHRRRHSSAGAARPRRHPQIGARVAVQYGLLPGLKRADLARIRPFVPRPPPPAEGNMTYRSPLIRSLMEQVDNLPRRQARANQGRPADANGGLAHGDGHGQFGRRCGIGADLVSSLTGIHERR